MAATAKITVPVLVRVNGKDFEIGTLELAVKMTASGKVQPPSVREVRAAIRKGLR